MVARCKYKNEFRGFSCGEDAVEGGLCVFHHPKYWEKNEKDVIERLQKKVKEAIKSKTDLIFIGYNLPEIVFRGASFKINVSFVESTFHGEADFWGVTFTEKASFEKATFIDKADFGRSTFCGAADFNETKFAEESSFWGAQFNDEADFRRTEFVGGTNFWGARFNDEADFSDATFTEVAEYGGTTFAKTAHFERTSFKKEASFWRAMFRVDADFTGVMFTERANLRGTTFTKQANFRGTTFMKEANFRGTTFMEEANFRGTRFVEEGNFGGATFNKKAEFGEATFMEAAGFWGTTFNKKAVFRGATFIGAANLERTKFFEEGDFEGATFVGAAEFGGATFNKDANFDGSLFGGRTVFNQVVFEGSVHFRRVVFLVGFLAKSLSLDNVVSFRRVVFEDQSKVIFDGTNMERASFIHTEVHRVRFRNIDWESGAWDAELLLLKYFGRKRRKFVKEKLKKLDSLESRHEKKVDQAIRELEDMILKNMRIRDSKGPRNKVMKSAIRKKTQEWKTEVRKVVESYAVNNKLAIRSRADELEKSLISDDDLTADNVLSVLRGLRENNDYNMRYEESGKFFIDEMEVKRRLTGKEGGTRSTSLRKRVGRSAETFVSGLYKWLCLYGESYARPLIWIIGSILFFAFLRLLILQDFGLFLDQLKASAATFFQLASDLEPLTISERLWSVAILGSFVVSLRRKLERRIRH